MNGHTEDRPKDCQYCYFWKQTDGCTYRGKTDCYYISAQKPTAAVSECDGCFQRSNARQNSTRSCCKAQSPLCW